MEQRDKERNDFNIAAPRTLSRKDAEDASEGGCDYLRDSGRVSPRWIRSGSLRGSKASPGRKGRGRSGKNTCNARCKDTEARERAHALEGTRARSGRPVD